MIEMKQKKKSIWKVHTGSWEVEYGGVCFGAGDQNLRESRVQPKHPQSLPQQLATQKQGLRLPHHKHFIFFSSSGNVLSKSVQYLPDFLTFPAKLNLIWSEGMFMKEAHKRCVWWILHFTHSLAGSHLAGSFDLNIAGNMYVRKYFVTSDWSRLNSDPQVVLAEPQLHGYKTSFQRVFISTIKRLRKT